MHRMIGVAFLFLIGLNQAAPVAAQQPAMAAPGTCETIEDNPGLKSDCETLLSVRDALAGGANLNWSSDVPMSEWDGLFLSLDTPARVKEIRLIGFNLNGTIPPELGNLPHLGWLWLYNNQLSGEIPPELGNLSNLFILSLSGNELSGEIPSELGNLSNLLALGLSDNQLSGEIPLELSNLSNLSTLKLNGNELSGEIPPELGNLPHLERLWLHNNQLSGEIPPELSNFRVRGLNLSNNELSGEIPFEFGENASNFLGAEVYLGNNNLTGCIPSALRFAPWDDDFDELGLIFCYEELTLVSIIMGPASPNQVVNLAWPDGEPIAVTLRVRDNLPSYVPGSVNAGANADYRVTYWKSDPRTFTFSHPDYGTIILEWSYDPTHRPEPSVSIVMGPASPNQTVNLAWPDGEPIAVTLRVYDNLPSYVPSSVDAGSDAGYRVDHWGSNPRTLTFFHPAHGDIILEWSYDPTHVEK